MRTVDARLAKLEASLHVADPVFLVTFANGTTQRMGIVALFMAMLDVEVRLPVQRITGYALVRGRIGEDNAKLWGLIQGWGGK